MRHCGKCREVKPHDAEHFVTVRGVPKTRCRVCANASAKAYMKTAKGRAVATKAVAAYRERHPDRVLAQSAKQRSNPAFGAAQRAWRQANPERAREFTRKWVARNREATVAAAAKRRAAIRGAAGTHTARDVQDQFNRQNGACYYCTAPLTKYHVDHMTPISRGGSNGPENIVCACIRCNLCKWTYTAEEFGARVNAGLVPHIQKVSHGDQVG
jgi:5-methylcytosine-specific restriction endonuclease McrA